MKLKDLLPIQNEAQNKIADIRKILKTNKGKRIDSIFMDVETAKKVIKHYKSLKGSAKEKFVKQKIQNIVKSVEESVGTDKNLLLEKVDLDQRIVDKIAKLTDINNHNEARIVLAKEMKLKNLVKSYEAIMVLHDQFRDMNLLMNARQKLDGWLMDGAKRKYGNFKDIYQAY